MRQIVIHDAKALHGQPEIIVGSAAILFDDTGSLWITTAGEGIGRLRFPEQLAGRGTIYFRFGPDVEKFSQKDGLSAEHVRRVGGQGGEYMGGNKYRIGPVPGDGLHSERSSSWLQMT